MSREDGARLADRLIAGEPGAFRDFVEAYKRKVFGLAFEMTRNHSDAEDVSQVAFMKVYRSIGSLKPGLGLNAWLYRIVYNTAIDHLRKKSFFPAQAAFDASAGPATSAGASPDAIAGRPAPGPFAEPADPSLGPERAAEIACLRDRIDLALGKISERERAAFVLRHYHDLSLKEIAETLGVTVGSVKSYLFRSIRKLQKELGGAEPCLETGDRP